MELQPHAAKQQCSHITSDTKTPTVCSNGAASFQALSRISQYLPLWVQLNFRCANTLCDSVGLDALRRLLVVPQKRGCYLIDLESLCRQFNVFVFEERLGDCKLAELQTFILTFIDQNCDSAIDLQAFFVNCCIVYGTKTDCPRAKLRKIVSRICEKNSSCLQRFGWLYYRRQSPASVANLPGNLAVNRVGAFYHDVFAIDSVCGHAGLAKWLSVARNVTSFYVPTMEIRQQVANRPSEAAIEAAVAKYQQNVMECWKPLFTTELKEEKEDPPATSCKVQKLYFANVSYDKEQNYTFIGLLSALGKLDTSKISHVSFLNGRLIETLSTEYFKTDARTLQYVALRNALTKIFPKAMLEFRQIVLACDMLCFEVCMVLNEFHDKIARNVESLNEVFNDGSTSTIGRIHIKLPCLPENEADFVYTGVSGKTFIQNFRRFRACIKRQCHAAVRFHIVFREGSSPEFSSSQGINSFFNAFLNTENNWIALDDTMRVLTAANIASRRAAVVNDVPCNLTFGIAQDPTKPYHEAAETILEISSSLRNMLFAQAEGILADKPWTYAEISLADGYFIDQVRSRSRLCHSFRKVRLDCRHDGEQPLKLRDYF